MWWTAIWCGGCEMGKWYLITCLMLAGCQIQGEPVYQAAPAIKAEPQVQDETDALLAEQQRLAEEAVWQALKEYEQADFDFVRGDAEAYR